MTDPKPGDQHPEEWRKDLNPAPMAGINDNTVEANRAEDAPTLNDIEAAHDRFPAMSKTDLKRIPVLPAGSRLQQGSTYVDLHADKPEEFTATSEMEAGPENWYVPKTEIDYELWNQLIGAEKR